MEQSGVKRSKGKEKKIIQLEPGRDPYCTPRKLRGLEVTNLSLVYIAYTFMNITLGSNRELMKSLAKLDHVLRRLCFDWTD